MDNFILSPHMDHMIWQFAVLSGPSFFGGRIDWFEDICMIIFSDGYNRNVGVTVIFRLEHLFAGKRDFCICDKNPKQIRSNDSIRRDQLYQ